MVHLQVDNIVKEFDEVVAVNGVSFSVEDGEFISILGPSGCGKTTLLKTIAGFLEPTSGRVVLNGRDLTGIPPEDRNMSLVFQDLALFPHLSVRDNLAFGLEMQTDLSAEEIDAEVAEALSLVELRGFGDRGVNELSGGQQQRVALARAIIVEPDILLYDEPLSNLDRQLRETMRREIRDLHEELGITSVYVTHNQREALTLADRIAVMREGQLAQFDSPDTLYTNPNSKFVADFVGDSNFINGTIRRDGAQSVFESNGLVLPLDDAPDASSDEPRDDMIYVRPEHIQFVESATEPRQITAEVQSVTRLGSTTETTVRVPSGDDVIVTTLGAPSRDVGEETAIEFTEYSPIQN